ncbi:MAG: hypothetical protein HJJLKODD_02077 [Phycisphaerae bacterium]|nr:hypothetical protein [Phycisphaerae bacterium]
MNALLKRSRSMNVALMVLLGLPAAVTAQNTPSDNILPADAWAVVQVQQLAQLDEKLAVWIQQLQVPVFRLQELLQTRLQLGDHIDLGGRFYIVFQPADTVDQIGPSAILLFPCREFAQWRTAHQATAIDEQIWQTTLSWGPTWVAQCDQYVAMGSNVEALRRYLQAEKGLLKSWPVKLTAEWTTADLSAWVNLAAVRQSSAGREWLEQLQPTLDTSALFINHDTLLSSPAAWLMQNDIALLLVDLNPSRLRIRLLLQPQSASVWDTLLQLPPAEKFELLNLLPTQPYLFTVAGRWQASQAQALAGEFNRLFDTPVVTAATTVPTLQTLRQKLIRLISGVVGGSWGVVAIPESPEGTICLMGVIQVADATVWLAELQSAAGLINDQLFVAPQANKLIGRVQYLPAADSILNKPIDQLTIDPPAAASQPVAAPPVSVINYWAAWGPHCVVQLVAIDQQHIAICVGGQARQMGQLLSHQADPASSLGRQSGYVQAVALLSAPPSLCLTIEPDEMLAVGRQLARRQGLAETFPYRTAALETPLIVGITRNDDWITGELIIPFELVAGMATTWQQRHQPHEPLQPPPDAN